MIRNKEKEIRNTNKNKRTDEQYTKFSHDHLI